MHIYEDRNHRSVKIIFLSQAFFLLLILSFNLLINWSLLINWFYWLTQHKWNVFTNRKFLRHETLVGILLHNSNNQYFEERLRILSRSCSFSSLRTRLVLEVAGSPLSVCTRRELRTSRNTPLSICVTRTVVWSVRETRSFSELPVLFWICRRWVGGGGERGGGGGEGGGREREREGEGEGEREGEGEG